MWQAANDGSLFIVVSAASGFLLRLCDGVRMVFCGMQKAGPVLEFLVWSSRNALSRREKKTKTLHVDIPDASKRASVSIPGGRRSHEKLLPWISFYEFVLFFKDTTSVNFH